MKSLAFILLLFVGCGGAASVGNISNQQDQNQTVEGDIQTAQEACTRCMESKGPDESLSDCVMSLGFDVSEC